MGNEDMIKRIIQNLIKNCLVHSDSNVEVSIYEENETIILSLKNKVKGLEQIDVDNLFNKFYVADKAFSFAF